MSKAEIVATCEACGGSIKDGEPHHTGVDCELCQSCAPSYGDMLKSCDHFVGTEGEPMKLTEAKAFVQGHLDRGGTLDDKIVF